MNNTRALEVNTFEVAGEGLAMESLTLFELELVAGGAPTENNF